MPPLTLTQTRAIAKEQDSRRRQSPQRRIHSSVPALSTVYSVTVMNRKDALDRAMSAAVRDGMTARLERCGGLLLDTGAGAADGAWARAFDTSRD